MNFCSVAGILTMSLLMAMTVPQVTSLNSAQKDGADMAEDQVLVKFRENVTADERKAVFEKYRLTVVNELQFIRVFVVKIPQGMTVKEAIAALAKEPQVEYAEPNYTVHTEK